MAEQERRRRRRVEPNPSAAAVHRAERGKPWRVAGEEAVRADNRKADPEIFRKRIFGLARQASVGLERGFGARVDTSDLAALLREGVLAKDKARAAAEEVRKRRAAAQEAVRAVQTQANRARATVEAATRSVAELDARIADTERARAQAVEEAAKTKGKPAAAPKKGAAAAAATPSAPSPADAIAAADATLSALRKQREELVAEREASEARFRELEADVDEVRRREAPNLAEDGDGGAGPRDPEQERLIRLYDAALHFDLAALRTLLKLEDKRPFDVAMTTVWNH
jgi:hypothetical protein